jgi:hypothetical protein
VQEALDYVAREWKTQHFYYLEERERQLQASGRVIEADLARQYKEQLDLPKPRLALLVDHLEELFTAGFSPTIRQKYIAALASLVRSGSVFVLITLRSDFYPQYQEFPDLVEFARASGKFDLQPPTPFGSLPRQPVYTFSMSRKRVNAWMKRCATPPPPHRNPCRCSSVFCGCSTTNRRPGVMVCFGGRTIVN